MEVPELEFPVTDTCFTSVHDLPLEITNPPKKRRKSSSKIKEEKPDVTEKKIKHDKSSPVVTSVNSSAGDDKNSVGRKTIKKEEDNKNSVCV